jgi:(S)-2-hydroxyglutarate dehydrogenase
VTERVDVLVVGGGVLGLAAARAVLLARPGAKVTLLEREPAWAPHQSGHNSNVIHSGLYYAPGSLKATLARAGGEALIRYCAEHGVPVRRTGKLVVATSEAQLPRMEALAERGRANGVTVTRLSRAEIREREPHVNGVAALAVAETAMTDFGAVCRAYAAELAGLGADLRTGTEFVSADTGHGEVRAVTSAGEFRAAVLVNCAGLHSDVVARASGSVPPVRVVPFRGEYAELRADRSFLVTNPVYPVPDPELPFLGVHLTPMLNGTVHIGPNAVPAFSRAGYRWRDVDPAQLRAMVTDPAVRRLAGGMWRHGVTEMARSLFWPLFVRDVRRLVPEVTSADLRKHGSGVRAQAVSDDGKLIDDFVITAEPHAVHVLNAPSPAATSSLLIGERIAEDVLARIGN